jgi:hypothetical protein
MLAPAWRVALTAIRHESSLMLRFRYTRRMRIRDGVTKLACVLVACAAALMSGTVASAAAGVAAGVAVTSAVILLGAFLISRWFRGGDEDDRARPWWRMTSRPWAGYVLSASFLMQTAWSAASASGSEPVAGWIAAGASALLAAAYLASSVRLTRAGLPATAPTSPRRSGGRRR